MKDAEIPFFARFLEGQEYPQVTTDVKAGPGGGTLPSRDNVVTMKWPSDGDDNPPTI